MSTIFSQDLSLPMSSISKGKSAFTPVLQKPSAQRHSPMNIFEPSPVQKFLYLTILAQNHQDVRSTAGSKPIATPIPKLTPTQYLRVEGCPDLLSTNAVRSESMQFLNQSHVTAPKSFSLDVVFPSKSGRGGSPLQESSLGSFQSGFDSDKDMESTDYSADRKDESEKAKSKRPLEINGMVIDNFMGSDDLNECVDILLRKEKLDPKTSYNKVIRHNLSSKCKDKKRRQRKNMDQHEILYQYFVKNPSWDKKTIQKLSDMLGLKESQIYKWNWDQRKKQGADE